MVKSKGRDRKKVICLPPAIRSDTGFISDRSSVRFINPVLISTVAVSLLSFAINANAEIHPFNSQKVTLSPTAEVGEIFNDNVTYVKNGKKADFITELKAGLRLNYESRQHYLDLYAEDIQRLFVENPGFSNNVQNAQLNYLYDITEHNRLRLKDSFTHYAEPRSFEDQFGRTGGRYDTLTNTFESEFAQDLSDRLSGSITYGNGFTLFSRKDLRDSVLNSGGTELRYFLSSATMISVGYRFSHRYFTSSDKSPSSSISTHAFTAGAKRYLTQQLYLEGKGGMDLFDSDSGLRAKPRFSFAVNDDIDKITTLQIFKFEKRSNVTAYQSDIFDYWEVSTGLSRELRQRLRGSLYAFYGNGKYKSQQRTDNLYGLNVSLIYDFLEHLQGEVGYSFSINASDQSSASYWQNQVGLRLRYFF